MDLQPPIVEPVFGHLIFTWNINHFFMCLTENTYFTESSKFSFACSNWSLKLSVRQTGSEIFIYLYVCRHDGSGECPSVECPNEIRAKFSLDLLAPSGMPIHSEELEYSLERNGFFRIISYCTNRDIFHDEYGGRDLEFSDDDTLQIVCGMITIADHHTVSLSEDKIILRNESMLMFETQECCNALLIATDEKPFPVHKEILAAHSQVFENDFETNSCVMVPFKAAVVKAMLAFIYSKSDARKLNANGLPSSKLYRCAEIYGISDLKKLLEPERVDALTIVPCTSSAEEFQITQFSRRLIEAETLTLQTCGTVQMKVTSSVDETGGNVHIDVTFRRVENSGRGTTYPLRVAALFFICDCFGQDRFKQGMLSDFHFSSEVQFRFFLPAENLFANPNLLFPGDTLSVRCRYKIRLPENIPCSIVTGNYKPHDTTMNQDKMEGLLHSQLFADLTAKFYSSNENSVCEMRVHKSILSAHSPVVRRMFRNMGRTISFGICDADGEALMSYMYGEKLSLNDERNDRQLDSLCALYLAAEEFEMSSLKVKCINMFKMRPFNPRTVLKKFVFASFCRDSHLKNASKNYFLQNMDIILGSEEWDRFRERYKAFADDILSY